MIFKSKLYRDEFKHWTLIVSLISWAILATIVATKNKEKTILIAISETDTRLITDNKDQAIKAELKNFLKNFIQDYYTYTEVTFSDSVQKASDFMSAELWEKQKPKFVELKEKLKTMTLAQSSEVLSLDQVEQNKIEGVLSLTMNGRALDKTVKLKINITFRQAPRTESNPYGYEVVEVSDALL